MQIIQLLSLFSIISATIIPQTFTDELRSFGKDLVNKVKTDNVIAIVDGKIASTLWDSKVPEGKIIVHNLKSKKQMFTTPEALHNFNPSGLRRKDARFLGFQAVPAKKGPIFMKTNPKPSMKRWKKAAILGGALTTGAIGTAVVLERNKHI
jgi:hypothetical protein